MNIDPTQWVALVLFFFLIATLYSSVGFGGGSSYLALLSLMGFSFFFIRTNALLCNLIVVSGSSVLFYKNKLIHFKDIFPFVVTSIPLTFLGSLLKLEETLFFKESKPTRKKNTPVFELYHRRSYWVFVRSCRHRWGGILSTFTAPFTMGEAH